MSASGSTHEPSPNARNPSERGTPNSSRSTPSASLPPRPSSTQAKRPSTTSNGAAAASTGSRIASGQSNGSAPGSIEQRIAELESIAATAKHLQNSVNEKAARRQAEENARYHSLVQSTDSAETIMKLLIAKQNEQIVEQNERITKLESQLNLLVEGKRSAIQEEELMRKKMEQLVGQKVVEMTNDAWGLRREFEKKASGMEKKMDEHVEYQRESVDLMWKQFRIFVAASISDAIPAANANFSPAKRQEIEDLFYAVLGLAVDSGPFETKIINIVKSANIVSAPAQSTSTDPRLLPPQQRNVSGGLKRLREEDAEDAGRAKFNSEAMLEQLDKLRRKVDHHDTKIDASETMSRALKIDIETVADSLERNSTAAAADLENVQKESKAAEKVLRTSLKKLWKRFELDRGSLNGVIEHSNALGVEITEDRDYIDRSCRKVIESNDVLLSADTSSRRATAERKFEEIQDFVWTMCLRVLETARARQLTIDACSQLLEIHTDDKLDEIDERLSAQGREIMLQLRGLQGTLGVLPAAGDEMDKGPALLAAQGEVVDDPAARVNGIVEA